jgi:hypothetical protein
MNQAYFEGINQFVLNNWWVLLLVIVWSAVWKGWALWKAGQLKDGVWFVALLVINTLGILEIAYIFFFSRRELKKGRKYSFTLEEAKEIGKTLRIKWDKYSPEQFRAGLDIELEHGLHDPYTNVTNDSPVLTGKIALAHLNEFPDYYTRLDKIEKEAEEFWKDKDNKE